MIENKNIIKGPNGPMSIFMAAIFMMCVPLLGLSQSESRILAFPSAEGFGRYASGGRGGEVYIVTNLNDSGEGSLRKGIIKHGPRTIVFAVSGTIYLKSPLDINRGDLTLAGQTAPGDGITLAGYPVSIKADNVIIRYMRFRMGDIKKQQADAIGGRDTKNVILDHCSMSWATDEVASFYRNHNFTMQWCIVSEALNRSVHEKGDHGYGGIWGGANVSFHHNLIASNNSRNPRFSGSSTTENLADEFVDFRNNVIYNWGGNSIYGGEKGTYNVVNNYFKSGPATSKGRKDRIVNPSEPYGKFYVDGNHVEGFPKISKDNWSGGVQCDDPQSTKLEKAISIHDNIRTQSAQEAYLSVLKSAGASLQRDAVDKRIIDNVRMGTATVGNGIIDSQEQVGGWPELKSGEAPKDSDQDGMPDAWEKAKGLDVGKDDSMSFTLDKEYTNLEVYINSLVEEQQYTSLIHGERYHFVVAQDGTGDFTSVQEAIDAVPNFRKAETRIFIKNGVYHEKLTLPATKTNVTFVGESAAGTILTYNDSARTLNRFGEEVGTTGSSSFFVFGDGFKAKNITFRNDAGDGRVVGQAVAARVSADRAIFEDCRFLGYQDTLYVQGDGTRQFYKNCYIEGTVDFIFGWATAVFEDCEIFAKDQGYLTAASTEKERDHGLVFINCRLTGSAAANTFYLGRPWRDHAQTVFINCYMDKHIKPEGWHNWNKPHAEQTTFYAEYGSTGPGANDRSRVAWAKQLTKQQADNYTAEAILKGADGWNPKK
ncbi:pectinesterase family protein [Flagellimonas baculiformis]|uniref:pectinesterase family protein n=1 Tax=Flagellimonas baculiformis TaxID=3067310 RepID=UPI00296E6C86|nr:pectinesterase family protein [Muricauda sp. D6]